MVVPAAGAMDVSRRIVVVTVIVIVIMTVIVAAAGPVHMRIRVDQRRRHFLFQSNGEFARRVAIFR